MLGGNSIWLITVELGNHCAPKALIYSLVWCMLLLLLIIITIIIIDYTADEKENGLKFSECNINKLPLFCHFYLFHEIR